MTDPLAHSAGRGAAGFLSGVWTLARGTFVQCLRTKVAVVFICLLAASLALLPTVLEGDGTLAGRIRTFLDYGLTASAALLALTVVFLSAGAVSNDVRDKHVFIVCSKPVGRWQYVLGRWLGVVLLAGVLLAVSGAAVYALAEYLRGRSDLVVRPEDRRAVETEVFAARRQVHPDPPNVDEAVAERVRRKRADGSWDAVVEAYQLNYEIPRAAAESKLVEDLRREVLAEAQSVAPGKALTWRFSGIEVRGETYEGIGRVAAVNPDAGRLAVEAPFDVTSRLVIYGPVELRSVESGGGEGGRAMGRVVGIAREGFHVVVPIAAMPALNPRPGREVSVRIEPMVQVACKVSASADAAGAPLHVGWKFENTDDADAFVYDLPPKEIRPRQRTTVIIPAATVTSAGRLHARMLNFSPVSLTVLNEDVSVLYRVGSFEANFLKTLALILAGLMFLAGLGVFAGTWLSFPVACLLCFVLLWIATATRFLTEAIGNVLRAPEANDLVGLYRLARIMLAAMKVVLPDLTSAMGTTHIVDGVSLGWGTFGEVVGLTVGVRAAALLLLGCVLFSRKELARVQV